MSEIVPPKVRRFFIEIFSMKLPADCKLTNRTLLLDFFRQLVESERVELTQRLQRIC